MPVRFLCALLLLPLLLWGCFPGDEPLWDDAMGPSLTRLRVAIVPDEEVQRQQERYSPLLDHLSRQLGVPLEVTYPESYRQLITLFGQGGVDLGYFGGLTFLQAQQDGHAVPLVMRDVDLRFTSVFVARTDTPGNTLEAFRGKRLAFGSQLSNSGHLMPRYFMMKEYNVIPERWFASIHYAGRHDATALMVRDGEADLGVANAAIVQEMFRDGRLSPEQVRVAWQTPPFANYVWAVRQAMPRSDRERLLAAFLMLSLDQPRDRAILYGVGANGFLPASDSDFSRLRAIAAAMHLLEAG